jgi:Arylsulfatase A and related enzymes
MRLSHRIEQGGASRRRSGLRAEDPTIAELLKPLGYATGQFGKNHFGDKDEFLPTKHGFDEFFGFLYHLNACEEPELRDYPTEKDFPRLSARTSAPAASSTARPRPMGPRRSRIPAS